MSNQQQPWLNNAWTDLIFILSPPFLCLLIIAVFPSEFNSQKSISAVYWLVLVVFIDVAHVYSTVYRTYFNKNNLNKHYALLAIIPFGCYFAGVLLYQINSLWFWRILAYLAVFHFIRQQYGFMKLYNRNAQNTKWHLLIDTLAIYSATLYPLVFWHLKGDRNFNWFIADDFIKYQNEIFLTVAQIGYFLILIIYLIKEVTICTQQKNINLPKNLLVFGTYLSWYFGIIYFNGDLIFTLLNVVSHGIPYMALIWFFEKKRKNSLQGHTKLYKLAFGKYGPLFFVAVIVALAYFEEALWDSMVWHEHESFFKSFAFLPNINDQFWLGLIVPLLVVPQATHYVLDGFIWKNKYDF